MESDVASGTAAGRAICVPMGVPMGNATDIGVGEDDPRVVVVVGIVCEPEPEATAGALPPPAAAAAAAACAVASALMGSSRNVEGGKLLVGALVNTAKAGDMRGTTDRDTDCPAAPGPGPIVAASSG